MQRYYPYDLFGQIPVTIPELYAWTKLQAPHIPEGWRTDNYIKAYDVAAKVAAAKIPNNK